MTLLCFVFFFGGGGGMGKRLLIFKYCDFSQCILSFVSLIR